MHQLKRILLALGVGTAAGIGITVTAALALWFADSELRTEKPEWYFKGWLQMSAQILITCTAVSCITSLVFTLRSNSVRLFRVIVYVAGSATIAVFVGLFLQPPTKGPGQDHWFAVAGALLGGFCVYWFYLPSGNSLNKKQGEFDTPAAGRDLDSTS